MLYYFPQWQGSFENNRLLASAERLHHHIENTFQIKLVDISLDSAASLASVDGIIARDAIIKQAKTAQAMLDSDQPDRVFTLGGDCGIEVMPVTYLNKKYDGNLTLIWIDAHGDLNTPQSSPSHTFHGMPLRTILGEGDAAIMQQVRRIVSPQQVIMLAVRDLDQPERTYVEQHAIPIISPETVAKQLLPVLTAHGYKNVYIHFDVDAFDPTTFSGTDYPTPGGLTMDDALQALNAVAGSFNIVGMSITEYSSDTDQGIETLNPLLEFFVRQATE